MPINEDSAKTSIFFKYEHTNSQGVIDLTYDLQFSYTEQYGPTISIFNDDGTVGAEFPAELFMDSVKYLSSRGVMPGMIQNKPDLNSDKTMMPRIVSSPFATTKLLDEHDHAKSDVSDVAPVGTFSPISMPVIDESFNEAPDPSKILAERQSAKMKAKILSPVKRKQ